MSNTRKLKAGKVIGAGGFGCVFKPALKCKNNKSRKLGISKLSTTYESNREFSIIKTIKPILNKIPNNNRFFIVNKITNCQPSKLTKQDYDNILMCNIISENSLSELNANINNYKIINMPDEGHALNSIIESKIIPFTKLNKLMINIFKKAIIPMNRLNLYHNDIKSENILYKNNNLKIIDFGEYFIFNQKKIPDIVKNRKILYNSPFSRLLFNSYFIDNINNFLKSTNLNKYSKSEQHLIIFKLLKSLYDNFIDKFQAIGHEEFLANYVFKALIIINPDNYFESLPKNIKQSPNLLLKVFILNYCTKIVYSFIDKKTNSLNIHKYFNEVYIKNVDVYGFISSYVDGLFYTDTITSTKIAKILLEFLYSNKYAVKHIDKDLLIKKLNYI